MSKFEMRTSGIEAWMHAADLQPLLTDLIRQAYPETSSAALVMGSARRVGHIDDRPIVGDLDLVCATARVDESLDFRRLDLPDWMRCTEKKAYGWHDRNDIGRMHVDAWATPWESLGPFAMFLTGPMQFNVWMRQRTQEAGLMLSQYGVFEPVVKPTKTYPNRRVAGRRLDRFDGTLSPELQERTFWTEWTRLTGMGDLPYPSPHEREEVWKRWQQERSRATRSDETTLA